jgi:exopolysaccharide biosynthesis protein
LLVGLILAHAAPVQLAYSDSGKVAWKGAGDDLEIGTIRTGSFPFLSSELMLIRTSGKQFQIGVLRTASFGKKVLDVRQLCKLGKAVACINANFFDEQHKPLGLVVSQGKTHHKLHKGGKTITGVFQVDRSGYKIKNRSEVKYENLLEAIQAGPRLISNGKRITSLREKNNSTRRSGICIDSKQRLVLYVVSSGVFGVSLEQLQEILTSPEVSCQDALNLDGGGSSQMYFSGEVKGAPAGLSGFFVEGSDLVPVAIALFQGR